MKVMVIGRGGREHALVWKLKQSPRVSTVYCAPGNGGISQMAEIVPFQEQQVKELIHFVKEEGIDFTLVGPEVPLLEGIVDQFETEGLRIYGPRKEAALIEGSKSFAKKFMFQYGIPTGAYAVFTDQKQAFAYLEEQQLPVVIKADGLAAGKGVVVARTLEEARQAIQGMLGAGTFGQAGKQIVVEEYLQGEELSLMAFVDGETVVPMVPAQDHKPVFNEDQGPNTGGMGAYSPVPHMNEKDIQQAIDRILVPAAQGLVQEGTPFTGILYAGLMMTEQGPKTIEFNARFGDPETQVVLPRLKTDLVDIIEATFAHKLDQIQVQWSQQAVVNVVAASGGYPGDYETGDPITGTEEWQETNDIVLFHSGTKEEKGVLQTAGGRVLSVTGTNDDVAAAREKVYTVLDHIHFEGMHYRTDIGQRGLIRG